MTSKRPRALTTPAKKPAVTPETAAPAPGPVMLRRMTLVLVVALLVARPVVLGEDPGLLSNMADPAGMVLTLLWMAAAVAWVGWRLWSGAKDQPFSLAEGVFLAVAILTFVAAEVAARYRHPARLIAWEWIGLLLTFVLIRAFASGQQERHGLFTALLATGVALGAQGIYQAAFELPTLRADFAEHPERLAQAMARQDVTLDPAALKALQQRIEDGHVFGPYAHPNSFASFLALLAPAAIGAFFITRRNGFGPWPQILAAGGALVVLAALWLTHSRGALLATALAGAVTAGIVWRRFFRAHKAATLAAVVLLGGAGAVLYFTGALDAALGKTPETAGARLAYWRTTGRMIADHPWLGVGPGNFGQMYPRYLTEADITGEVLQDPHNFALEIWASAGLFALIALLVLLTLIGLRIADFGRRVSRGESPPPRGGQSEISWVFYIGGSLGLLLCFVLRAMDLPGEAILSEALTAVIRAVVWFVAFGLLERLSWTPAARVTVLTAGAAALLLNLCVSGGIAFPSVAGMLWAALALALADASPATATAPEGALQTQGTWAARYLLMPVVLAVTGVYFLFVFVPVSNSATQVHEALQAVRVHKQTIGRVRPEKVLPPLEEATREDPGNAHTWVLLAKWYGQWWASSGTPTARDEFKGNRALQAAREAQRLNPEGREPYEAEYNLWLLFAKANEKIVMDIRGKLKTDETLVPARKDALRQQAEKHDQQRKQRFKKAARLTAEYLPRDPTDPRLHYRLAATRREAGLPGWREPAREALRLDELLPPDSPRKLTASQRVELRKWLA
jgi:hypothetical protein